ncbi:DUF2971 domain-containing protein [Hathewaya histolytica]|uniref:DUF2971 domain-containing protein n=1 Tax=Hathewaya histolytica TaxID=1498 RepID=UPI003B67109E
MKDKTLIIHESLKPQTKLYRYMKLSCFLELMEMHAMYLTNLNSWDDIWELPARNSMSTKYKDKFYGQCWSLEGISDALWKIYAKDKEGILIETSVKKLNELEGLKLGKLSPVIYYEDLNAALQHSNSLEGMDKIFYHGLLKRKAFEHEKEVRLITLKTDHCMNSSIKEDNSNLLLKIRPESFIENIYIDPRASNWFVDTIKTYCTRLNLSVIPKKSDLS